MRCEEEGRLDDAVHAWMAVARLAPTIPQAFERLFELHVHRREVDAAFCAASVLASLDALEGMARELYEDYVPRRLSPRVAGRCLDAEDWALLRHPAEDPAVGERLAAVLSKVSVKPASAAAIDASTLAWAASLLGAHANDVPRDEAPTLVGRNDLDEVWGNYTLRERLFFAGRAATALRVPVHALESASMRQLSEALGGSVGEDVERWMVGVMLTRARAGMLVCGEPVVARQLLEREGAGEVALGQLALFTVSPEHHRLRAKLGIAIGMAADAPADLAPPAAAPATSVAPTRTPDPAPHVNPPPPRLVQALDGIIQPPAPPATVRDLERALGLALTDAHLAACTQPGDLVIRTGLPPPLVAVGLRWRGSTIPRSAEALRGRALAGGWYIELAEGRGYVDARLFVRFGAARELSGRNEYASQHAVFILTWVGREHACTLAFAEPALG